MLGCVAVGAFYFIFCFRGLLSSRCGRLRHRPPLSPCHGGSAHSYLVKYRLIYDGGFSGREAVGVRSNYTHDVATNRTLIITMTHCLNFHCIYSQCNSMRPSILFLTDRSLLSCARKCSLILSSATLLASHLKSDLRVYVDTL